MELSRFDGTLIEPAVREQTEAECAAKAQAAQFGVNRQIGDVYGIGRAVEMGQVHEATFKGCMAEKGIRVTWVQPSPTPPATSSVAQSR
jgi:hypothetical protein